MLASVLLVSSVLSLCSRYCGREASSDVLLLNCLVLVCEERIVSLAHYLGDWLLSVSAQAVIAEYHSLGALKKYIFLTVLEAGKSEIQVSADLASGENWLPGL